MATSTDRYRARVAAGLCGRCGMPAVPGRSRCEHHLATARDASNRIHAERRGHGICIVCGREPAEEGFATCSSCAEHRAEYTAEYVAAKRSEGACRRCLQPAAPGHSLCAEHIAVDRAEGAEERATGRVGRDRDRRADYREAGLCSRCGEPPEPGRSLCARHAEIARADAAKHRAKIRAAQERVREVGMEIAPGVVRRRR